MISTCMNGRLDVLEGLGWTGLGSFGYPWPSIDVHGPLTNFKQTTSMTDTPYARVQIAEGVMFQKVMDEAVLLNVNDNRYFGLDDVGTRMWLLLEEHGEPETVVRELSMEYGVEESRVRQDLADFIDKMKEFALIVA